uniref:Uncharacterized protein n=1 Tax=Haptolina brevifila TaxID=156173 RepID=A0A7S2GTG9_9EUKA
MHEAEQHIECYQDMNETYKNMYLKAADVAKSLASPRATQPPESNCKTGRASPDWLDGAMQVPVVPMPATLLPPVAIKAALSDHESDDDEKDTVEVMIKNDICKYGAEKTSQRWVR